MIITRCIAFNHSAERPREWMACNRRTRRGDRFCTIHRNALDGAILGLLQWEQRFKGADRENNAYFIPEKARRCKACGARQKWRIPNKRARRRLLNRANKTHTEDCTSETGDVAQTVAVIGGQRKEAPEAGKTAIEEISVSEAGN